MPNDTSSSQSAAVLEPVTPDSAEAPPVETVTTTVDSAPKPAETSPNKTEEKKPFSRKVKNGMLRVIDLTALGFLEPVVRLCYGEEPKVQLKKIGQFMVLPLLAFALFIGLWAIFAPHHKTKYGALPTPTQVWAGADSAFTFHDREMAKSAAYLSTGDDRQRINAAAAKELATYEALAEKADQAVLDARAKEADDKALRLDPLRAKLDELKTAEKEGKKERKAALNEQAEAIASDADRTAFLAAFAAFKDWETEQKAKIRTVNDQIKVIQDEKTPAVQVALLEQTRVAEKRNFAAKIVELSGEDSREEKIASAKDKLSEYETAFAGASGAEAYKLASRMYISEARLPGIEASLYAKPWTLPMQIVRSIVTVFVGFFIGVAIAIPLGVLCGLSTTFMAVMTPFIALFKPVSPIVWLLVLWIIVGGFFPNPDDSATLDTLNAITNAVISILPIAGAIIEDIDINPALIASALTVAMCSLWATMVNTALGVASVDKDHLNVARVLRLGFWARLRKIVLPSALPLMFAGMRISLGIGWMVLIAAELLASSEGLGKYVNDMFQNGNTDSFSKIMAMVFVVGIIGLILDRIMIVFQRLVSFEGSVAAV